jgi:hypothetical protein
MEGSRQFTLQQLYTTKIEPWLLRMSTPPYGSNFGIHVFSHYSLSTMGLNERYTFQSITKSLVLGSVWYVSFLRFYFKYIFKPALMKFSPATVYPVCCDEVHVRSGAWSVVAVLPSPSFNLERSFHTFLFCYMATRDTRSLRCRLCLCSVY